MPSAASLIGQRADPTRTTGLAISSDVRSAFVYRDLANSDRSLRLKATASHALQGPLSTSRDLRVKCPAIRVVSLIAQFWWLERPLLAYCRAHVL
jgi:hypothetical protein